MPRINAVTASPDAGTSLLIERIKAERGGKLLLLYQVLLNSPAFAEGWLSLLTAVRQSSSLPGSLRELIILRIAILNDAPYEFAAHAPFALREGVPQSWIDAMQEGTVPANLARSEAAALQYAHAMTREVSISEAIFASVRAEFDDRELLELTVTIAAYNMVSRVLSALKIEEEH